MKIIQIRSIEQTFSPKERPALQGSSTFMKKTKTQSILEQDNEGSLASSKGSKSPVLTYETTFLVLPNS